MIKIIITDASKLSGTELASLKNFFDNLLQAKLDKINKVNEDSENLDLPINSNAEKGSALNFLQDAAKDLGKIYTPENIKHDVKLTHINMFTEAELAEMSDERKNKVVLQHPQRQPNPAELFNNEEGVPSVLPENGLTCKEFITELDSAGQPWDERLHANNKRKNKDGTWRTRRNTAKEPEEIAEVETKSNLPPPPPILNTGITFNDLMIKIQKAISANRLTVMQVQQVAEKLGMPNIAALSKQPFLIVKVDELITQEIDKYG